MTAESFVHAFDCTDETHVMWLKKVGDVTVKAIGGMQININQYVNDNPLPGRPTMHTPAEWAYVHFQLCMKYATAVLNSEAFVPTKLV
jgi:hypothetical protein